MSDIEWSDPPSPLSPNNRQSRQQRFLAALRDEPKRWARLPRYTNDERAARNAVRYINSGRAAGAVRGEFEATGRKLDDGTYGVWVRYVGTDTKP